MAHPFLFEEDFEDGTKGLFETETDAGGILDYPHYSELARFGLSPYRGAYCARGRMAGTAVAELVETGSFDTALDGSIHVKFHVLIAADVTIAASGAVDLFTLDSTGPVQEVNFGVRNNAGVYEFYAGETGATRTYPIVRSNSQWYTIELAAAIDDGVSDDGTLDFYVDGQPVGAQITGLDQAAISQGRYGVIAGTASGDAGTILFGPIYADDARMYPNNRFPGHTIYLTKSRHAYIGQGRISRVSCRGTSNDTVVNILDTDRYFATGLGFSRDPLLSVKALTNNDLAEIYPDDLRFQEGCFALITGTAPEAWIELESGAVVQSHGGYVNRGLRRNG